MSDSNDTQSDTLSAILEKLEEISSTVEWIEQRAERQNYDSDRMQRRLKALIKAHEEERQRNEKLEALNQLNIERIARFRAGYAHLWDRADTLIWMKRLGAGTQMKVEGGVVVKEEEKEAVIAHEKMEEGGELGGDAGDIGGGAGEEDDDYGEKMEIERIFEMLTESVE